MYVNNARLGTISNMTTTTTFINNHVTLTQHLTSMKQVYVIVNIQNFFT